MIKLKSIWKKFGHMAHTDEGEDFAFEILRRLLPALYIDKAAFQQKNFVSFPSPHLVDLNHLKILNDAYHKTTDALFCRPLHDV
jgi:hypothetical protein